MGVYQIDVSVIRMILAHPEVDIKTEDVRSSLRASRCRHLLKTEFSDENLCFTFGLRAMEIYVFTALGYGV